ETDAIVKRRKVNLFQDSTSLFCHLVQQLLRARGKSKQVALQPTDTGLASKTDGPTQGARKQRWARNPKTKRNINQGWTATLNSPASTVNRRSETIST